MKSIRLSAIAIIALLTFSCSSDDEDKPTLPQAKMVKKEVSVQSGGATSTTTFGYDAFGRLLTKTTADEAITYSRNSVGKIIQAVIVNSGTDRIVTYTYDASGRISEMQKRQAVQSRKGERTIIISTASLKNITILTALMFGITSIITPLIRKTSIAYLGITAKLKYSFR
jgi:YD repeat-containing protein